MDAHHIGPWLAGGRTDISNLVLVCRFHHGLIDDRGYQTHWINGDLEFRRPGGAPIPQAARACQPTDVGASVEVSVRQLTQAVSAVADGAAR